MADNERQKRNYPPRKSQQYFRPPPGVQKAIQNLGVTDLREIIDRKRHEQGELPDNKKSDINPPPPDPSYNYLKDPTRDRPKPAPQKRSDNDRHQNPRDSRDTTHYHRENVQEQRSRNNRDTTHYHKENVQEQRPRDNRDTTHYHKENVQEQRPRDNRNTTHYHKENLQEHKPRDSRDTTHYHKENFQEHKPRDSRDTTHYRRENVQEQKPRDSRNTTHFHRENKQEGKDRRHHDKENKVEDNPEKGVLKKNQNSPHDEGETKKELRFVEPSKLEEQFTRGAGGRHSFRGRNSRRGGMSRESGEKKIENPINIKIELSTQTGQRNCILDKTTKIAEIKHVPDTPIQKVTRGGYRGSRSNFRSRGRGRGSFRGRGGFITRKGTEYSKDATGLDNNFNNEKSQRPIRDDWDSKGAPPVKTENHHNSSVTSSFEQNSQESNGANKDYDNNQESYEEYDQENEEFGDASEQYNEEYSNDYQSEYKENAAQKLEDIEKSETNITDPDLNETITITSSKCQDGEVKRSIDIKENTNVTDEKQKEKSAEE